ncbi:MAG: succinylglutamate desuccinylase/aspartoacylase family protein [Planctomycetes bacterium]|nr:succinylglutamate desuccinylase/aspartoacylase family protein [Planctomycetota bacterium]
MNTWQMRRTFPQDMKHRLIAFWLATAVGFLWTGCLPQASCADKAAPQAKKVYCFEQPGVSFSNGFSGARLNDCVQLESNRFRVVIRPENTPINNSAWYAFKVTSDREQTITVQLTYENGTHRYRPKVSHDGLRWKPLDPDAYETGPKKKEVTLQLKVGPDPLWVAGQEMIGVHELNEWLDGIAKLPFAKKSLLGRSVEGLPIYKLELTEAAEPENVMIIGRQHPPEVTGSIGLMAFVETLTRDDELARQFRAAFRAIVVPLVNPDGVEHGHWRHSVNGVDLNRDWGPFAQPETRAVRDEILQLRTKDIGRSLYLFVDFHSTHRDVFYTQRDDQETFPKDFAANWLTAVGKRASGHSIRRVGVSGSKPTSQRWVYRTLGAATITYELGDNTDREQIRRVATISAEEMMRLLLLARQNASVPTRVETSPSD